MKKINPAIGTKDLSVLRRVEKRAEARIPRGGAYIKLTHSQKRQYNILVNELLKEHERTPKEMMLINELALDSVKITALENEGANQVKLESLKRSRRATLKLLSTYAKFQGKKIMGNEFYFWREKVRMEWGLPPSEYKDLFERLPQDGKQRRFHNDGITRTRS